MRMDEAIFKGIIDYEESNGFSPENVHISDRQYTKLLQEIYNEIYVEDKKNPDGYNVIYGIRLIISDSDGPHYSGVSR